MDRERPSFDLPGRSTSPSRSVLVYSLAMLLRFLLVFAFSTGVCAQTVADNSKADNPTKAAAPSVTSDAVASANALLKARKFSEAVAAFKVIVEKDPSSAGAHAGLIRSLMRARKFDEAQQAGKRALETVPSSSLIHATVGDLDFRMGELSDAEIEYRAALKLDANSPRGLYGMGQLYEMVSMYKHAQEAFRRAHEQEPSDRDIFLAWVSSLPRAEAYAAFKKGLEKDHVTESSSPEATDSMGYRDSEILKILAAEAEKKPWELVGEPRSTEIKMQLYGRTLADVGNSASQIGARAIGKGYGLQVKFNDKASSVLLLDTGAPGLVIGHKLAEKAGVVKIAESRFTGVGGGFTQSYMGWVDKIKIGDVEFRNCIVEVSSRNDVADEAGLIGPNIFKKFLVTLDFKEWKLLLAPLPKNPNASANDEEPQDRYIAPEMQSFTKVYNFDDHLVVPATLGTASKNATGLFLLDTGASSNTISVALASKLTKVSYEEGYVTGVSGKIKEIFSGDKIYLHFAGVHVRSDDILAFDHKSIGGDTEIAGLIGITTLTQMKMTIDYRDGLVKLEPYQVKNV